MAKIWVACLLPEPTQAADLARTRAASHWDQSGGIQVRAFAITTSSKMHQQCHASSFASRRAEIIHPGAINLRCWLASSASLAVPHPVCAEPGAE